MTDATSTDDLVADFVAEARELIQAAAEDLLALDGAPDPAAVLNRIFRAFHTLKGSAALFDWPDMLAVLHAAEDGLDAARAGRHAAGPDLVDLSLAALDATARWTEAIAATGSAPAGTEAEAARLVERYRSLLAPVPAEPASVPAGPVPDWAAGLLATLHERPDGPVTALRYVPRADCFFAGDDPLGLVRRLPRLLALDLAPAMPWPSGQVVDAFACNLAVTLLTADPAAEVEAVFRLVRDQVTVATLAPPAAMPGSEPVPDPDPLSPEPASRTLRVDAGRIDALVALADDLATARAALGAVVAKVVSEAAAGADLAALLPSLRAGDERIGRLSAELHREAVALRLQPLGRVFRRFPRPLRDLARGLGKEVGLSLEGEATEVDRDVAEGLFEPLLHLLRNAVDHGIEAPEARARTGKPAAGRIRLRAESRGERVVVSVSDDGRGLDSALIRARAAERGLRTPDALAALDEAGVIDLIFAPGFSTAAAIGAVSGRGVGMDAVREAVSRLGGACTVESRPGEGTTVRLALPRAQSLARLLLVGIGPELYGLPMEAVDEVARVPRERIRDHGLGAVTALRDRTVPILHLADLLGLPREAAPSEAHLAVLRLGDERVAVEVERFAGRLDGLVRPLPSLAALPGLAGTTLTGDGRVLLVLDPETLPETLLETVPDTPIDDGREERTP
ncbi:chemotaxis protein CheA [Methylobacterium sp. SyP6R]|uniref:chemotaxis protein CheA n=1 Tax=Methylobacterium sp. SyP6R TaxID=2718876 RepID=UPI001F164EB3|nr:chemotaxis protein CheA [Methylobacterium sp. SyP6R]MCF4127842.1 chemotaxis protein CheA [Methylobacterium sp. SyP6R]